MHFGHSFLGYKGIPFVNGFEYHTTRTTPTNRGIESIHLQETEKLQFFFRRT